MLIRSSPRRRSTLLLERLEDRLVLDGGTLTIPLDEVFDQFGDQIGTIQAYGNLPPDFSIFDTGASVVTFGADDLGGILELLGWGSSQPIPIKVRGGAVAEGIGGTITGDVSMPGLITADGMHNFTFDFDLTTLTLDIGASFDANSGRTPNIQAFVGTPDGSPELPTITGTPLLNPAPGHPNGYAAFMDMQGALLNFGDLGDGEDFIYPMPDIRFVAPGVRLTSTAATTEPVYLNVSYFGLDNHLNPGNLITEGYNPLVNGLKVTTGSRSVARQTFLFDTGAQLSIISSATARALGFDLSHPETSITVSGVGGSLEVPGYTVDKISMPRSDGGLLEFTEVPVYVLDIGDGIDGIFGMNMLNTASQFVYDPFKPGGPQLGFTFFKERIDPGDLDDLGGTLGGLVKGVFQMLEIGTRFSHAVNYGVPKHFRLLLGSGSMGPGPDSNSLDVLLLALPLDHSFAATTAEPADEVIRVSTDQRAILDLYYQDLPPSDADANATQSAHRLTLPADQREIERLFALWNADEIFHR